MRRRPNKGLFRVYRRIYGTLALAPKRRLPMTRTLWAKIELLQPGQPLPGRSAWMTATRYLDTLGRRLGRVLGATAHRLGEIVEYLRDELSYLSLAHVTYRLAGVVVVDPTAEQQLQIVRAGDLLYLVGSMLVQTRSIWGGALHVPFGAPLRRNGHIHQRRLLFGTLNWLEAPCRGTARRSLPLFADEHGRPYSYTVLNAWLHGVVAALASGGGAGLHYIVALLQNLSWRAGFVRPIVLTV